MPLAVILQATPSPAAPPLTADSLSLTLESGARPEVNQAIERIRYAGSPQSLMRPLEQLVVHGGPRGRQNAAYVLASVGQKSSVPSLLKATEDEDVVVREHACVALGRLKARAAVKRLVALTRDLSPVVRRRAVEALGGIGDKAAFAATAEMLDDNNVEARQAAMLALGALGDRRAAAKLSPLLKSSSEQTRLIATRSLAMLGDPGAQKLIDGLLASEFAQDRRDGIQLLDGIDRPWVKTALFKQLSDPEFAVRVDAAKTLARVGDGRGVQFLVFTAEKTDGPDRLKLETAIEDIKLSPEDRKKVLGSRPRN